MNSTAKNTRRILIATPIVGLAVIGSTIGIAGIANAGTLPTTGTTVAMTIYNDTNQTMTLTGDYTSTGDFIAAPRETLAPHTHEIVTAASPDRHGFTTTVNYGLPNTSTIVSFSANNTPGQASTDGTGIGGTNADAYGWSSTIDTGAPAMNASYHVGMNPAL